MEEDLARTELLSELSAASQRPLGGTGTISAARWVRNKFTDLIRGNDHEALTTAGKANERFPSDLQRSFFSAKVNQQSIGRMFLFYYDPKTKAKLPYYDAFPLILLVDMHDDGFTGLNLHYVHPLVRIKILEALVKNVSLTHLETDFLQRTVESKQIAMNYRILKESAQYPMVKPCFKKYLSSHVRSNFMYIDPTEWPKVVLLPVERFKGAPKTRVFADSASSSAGRTKTATASTARHTPEAIQLSTSNKQKSIYGDDR